MPEIHKDIIYLVIIKSENGQLNLTASIDASTWNIVSKRDAQTHAELAEFCHVV